MSTSTALPERPPGAASSPPATTQPWIYRPWLDLVVGCGAWSAPLLLVAAFAAKTHVHAWSFAFYFLALLFNYPHFMATAYRAYHTREDFAKYRLFTLHIALLLALTGVLAHILPVLLPWIFTLYICWSPWHYTGQNFGLAMMFTRRAGLAPTSRERRALHLGFIASYVLLMFSFHTGPSDDALILSLGLPARFSHPVEAALGLFFLGNCGWALASLARRSCWRFIIAPATLCLSQLLWFVLPTALQITTGLAVPQTRYSSGVLAIFHSAQYIWITSYYQKREARAAGDTSWSLPRYFLTLLAGGIALFIPGPWIVSRAFHLDFTASFLTFTALVNIHHFILDGALWKLRDSRIAALLLDTRGRAAAAASSTGNGVLAATRWLAGKTRAAQALRISLALALFAWAALDQVHFYWGSQETQLAALQRAAALNPYDSEVQSRIAKAQSRTGNSQAAIDALTRAVSLRPGDLRLQEMLGRQLIQAGRKEEAYKHYQKLLARFPSDTNAWVNYGLLALQLGRPEEAADSWHKAVDLDPSQANAQLYLAQALDARGEALAAAQHYRAYLAAVAAHPAEHRADTSGVLVALVKVADADAATHHTAEATKSYQAAINYAEQVGDKSIESLALAHLADLQEKNGDVAGAAKSYQRALAVDESGFDAGSAASDWVNYGDFLRRHGQLERLVFACFLQAEGLLRTTPGAELVAVAKVRAASEARLGPAAASVRRSLDSALQQARAVPASVFQPAS